MAFESAHDESAGAKARIRALCGVANPRRAAIGPQDPFAVCALLPSPNCALLLLMAREPTGPQRWRYMLPVRRVWPLAACRRAREWLAWAWVMARPSASAASCRGAAGRASRRRTISCTCALAARPWPATVCFICRAVHSVTGRFCHVWGVAAADFAYAVIQELEPRGQAALGCVCGLDDAAGHVGELAAGCIQHAEAGGAQAGVDAEDSHGELWRKAAGALHGQEQI